MVIFPGCAPANSAINCPPGFLWRDAVSCVRIADCTCRSHSGKPIKVSLEKTKNDLSNFQRPHINFIIWLLKLITEACAKWSNFSYIACIKPLNNSDNFIYLLF